MFTLQLDQWTDTIEHFAVKFTKRAFTQRVPVDFKVWPQAVTTYWTLFLQQCLNQTLESGDGYYFCTKNQKIWMCVPRDEDQMKFLELTWFLSLISLILLASDAILSRRRAISVFSAQILWYNARNRLTIFWSLPVSVANTSLSTSASCNQLSGVSIVEGTGKFIHIHGHRSRCKPIHYFGSLLLRRIHGPGVKIWLKDKYENNFSKAMSIYPRPITSITHLLYTARTMNPAAQRINFDVRPRD